MRVDQKFPVVYKDTTLILKVKETPFSGEIFPGAGSEMELFDTYEEAQAFINENKLVYKDPQDEFPD